MARAKKSLDINVVAADVVGLHTTGDQCTVTFLVDSDMGGTGAATEDVTVTLPPVQVARMDKVITGALKIINKE